MALSMLLSSCVPFNLWSGQSSCETAVSAPQVTTLSWEPTWDIDSVDINQNGEFFFSPRSDIYSKWRWDTLIRVNREGQQTDIRTGPEVTKPTSYITVGDTTPPPIGSPGDIAVFGAYIWVKDYRGDGQIRHLNTFGLWLHEEVWLKEQPIKELLWSGYSIHSGSQGQLFARGGRCSIYQVMSGGINAIHNLPQNSVQEACPLSGPMTVDANTIFYVIASRVRPSNAIISVDNWPPIPTDILSQTEIDPTTDKVNISNEIYRISNNQFERWAGSAVEGFQDGFQEKATFRKPSYLAAARDGYSAPPCQDSKSCNFNSLV